VNRATFGFRAEVSISTAAQPLIRLLDSRSSTGGCHRRRWWHNAECASQITNGGTNAEQFDSGRNLLPLDQVTISAQTVLSLALASTFAANDLLIQDQYGQAPS